MSEYVSRFTGQEIDEFLQKSKDITKTASEINSSMALVDKVESGINNAAVGEIVAKNANGGLEGVGIINEADKIFFPKDGRFPSGSIDVGPGATISENGGWLQYKAQTLGRDYILLDYELTDQGTTRPVYWERGAEEQNIVVNPNNGQTIAINSFTHTPSTNSQINALFFDFAAPVTNLCVEIVSKVTGKPIKYIPNEQAWKNNTGGLNLGTGIQNVLVGNTLTPFSALTAYELELNLNQTVSVKGLVDKPYMVVNRQAITAKNVLLEGEGSGGSSTFTALTDTPNAYAGQADKYVRVKTDESGLEFTSSSGTVDIDGVPDDDFLKKGVQAGLLQQDLADVDIQKLYEKGIDAKLADKIKQDGLIAEVERLKTDINTNQLDTYAWRDRGVPVIDNSKAYKAYYIHSVVLKDDLGVIAIPSLAPNGAIFSVENNDRSNYLTLQAPSGETINGSASSYRCDSDTLNFFVKDGADWKLAYGGVFPNNLDALKSTISVLFPNSLFTIADVQAQLKDRLHTFREIQNEFATQLHTFDAIEADMIAKGFSKGFSVGYGILSTNTPPQDLNWVQVHIAPNAEVIIPATNQGNKFLAVYMPVFLAAMVDDVNLNQQPIEVTESKIVSNELEYTILIAKNQIDTNQNNRLSINFHSYAPSVKGIEIDDGTTDKAEITKINLVGGKLSKVFDDSGEVTLTLDGKLPFVDGQLGKDFDATKVQSLDKSIRIANLNGVADLSAVNQNHNEGILAFLGSDELLNSKFGKSKLYFSDIRVKGGMYVYADMQNKAFVIQDIDPQDDPLVSGGTTFIVAMYFDPSEQQDVLTQDGYIEISLVKNDDSVLLDTDGNPMAVRIDYKAGDVVKPEIYIGEVQAKAYTDVHMKIHPVFPNEEIISVGSNTCLCLQSITKDESSGMALLSFMAFTGIALKFDTRYYGYNSMNLAQNLIFPVGESDIPAGVMNFGNNLYINNQTPIKMGIQGNRLTVKDDGTNIPVFSITKFYDSLDSHYMSNKQYKITATITNKNNGFDIAMLEYTGNGTPTPPKVESYNNGAAVFTTGWTSVDALFISEDPITDDAVHSKTIEVPSDAKGIAIVMYPISSEIPTTLILKDLEGDITPWFNKVVITDNSHIREKYLEYMDFYYTFSVNTPDGLAGYRYTCNNTDTKVPVGVVSGGDGKVVNDNSWHDAGSNDPNKTQGDFKFLVDGIVKSMTYEAQCYNEQGTINSIEFWLAKVNGDGTFTEVPNSRIATTIEASRTTPKLVSSAKFNFEVKANESYRMFMKSDKADGFYIQSGTNGVPLFTATIEFDEITTAEKSILDQLTLLDQEIVITKAAQDAKCYIELDFKSGKPVLTAKQR